jgi:hypothetical protein
MASSTWHRPSSSMPIAIHTRWPTIKVGAAAPGVCPDAPELTAA